MSEKKTISVMIPCYNEEQNARPIYEAVRDELVKSCPNYDYEILFIDNKSEDGTRAIIRQICAEDKHVKAIFNVKNFGQFNSPYYGMIHTSGDCTITMCADFQDPVEMIPRFVAEWEKGYKIVIGRKTQSKENPVMYWLRGNKPASGDTISSSAPAEGVDDPTADNFTAESTPAEEAPAEPEATPEPTPEPTPVPEYEGLSVQPTTYYNEGEQPTYTVTDGNNLNMRSGPGTDYDKIGQVPASTGVTALGTNEDGSWVVVNYNGTYGWLKTEFLNG